MGRQACFRFFNVYMNFYQSIKQQRTRQKLKGCELARRMGVSPARVSMLERDEANGAVTLKMLQRAAEALDCRLEYRLVPQRTSASKPRIRLSVADVHTPE